MSDSEEELHDYIPREDEIFDYMDVSNAMFFALLHGNVDKLKEQLVKGMNPNVVDNTGATLLHHCALVARIEIIDALVKYSQFSLNWCCRNWNGETPLFLACRYNRPFEVIMKIIDLDLSAIHIGNTENVTPLHKAVRMRNSNLTSFLIEKGCDLNCVDFDNCTPIHEAIADHNWENISCLLSYGADLSLKATAKNLTPFNLALQVNLELEYVQEFMKHVCEEYILPIESKTMECVVWHGNYDLFRYFWQRFKKKKNRHMVSIFENFIKNMSFDNDDWLAVFYDMADSRVGPYLIQSYTLLLRTLCKTMFLRSMNPDKLIKLLYTILSHGPSFTYDDLLIYYETFGYGKIFDVFINASPHFTSPVSYCETEYFKPICYVCETSHYCVESKRKEFFQMTCISAPYDRCPKLFELARNCMKKQINEHLHEVNSENPFDYIYALRTLHLPEAIIKKMLYEEYR